MTTNQNNMAPVAPSLTSRVCSLFQKLESHEYYPFILLSSIPLIVMTAQTKSTEVDETNVINLFLYNLCILLYVVVTAINYAFEGTELYRKGWNYFSWS